MTAPTPNFKTDAFFNLKDSWIETAPHEITHYYDQGHGVPMLMLHGSGLGASAALNWWLNIPELSQIARTLAFDLIGYGETICAPDTTYGIKQWGAQTIRLMDALHIDKAWLVGSSLGGWIALQLALDYPERILGVVSIGTGGAKSNDTLSNTNDRIPTSLTAQTGSSDVQPIDTKPLANKHKSPLSAAVIRKDFKKNIRNDTVINDNLVNIRLKAALKEQEVGLRSLLLAARDRDREDLPLDLTALGQLSLPVLLIHGMNDKVVPLSRTLQLLNAMPTADAHIFSESGHWPHLGKSDEFNSLVRNFVSFHSD